MKKLLLFSLLLLLLTACTYSITMVHTEGTATDVVDEDQGASPTLTPTVNVE